jgi:thiol-disulfide isomerase/thioredoxin
LIEAGPPKHRSFKIHTPGLARQRRARVNAPEPVLPHLMPLVVREDAGAAVRYGVPGRITIIAFEAVWCAPCRDVKRYL